jgi:hypothetical protein
MKATSTETVTTTIETPAKVVSTAHHFVDTIRKPLSAIGQFFWDAKANTFSVTNLILVIGVAFGMTLMWDTRNMMWALIDRGSEVSLDAYFIEIVGFFALIISPYVSKRIGTRHDRYPTYPSNGYVPEIPSDSYRSVAGDDPDINSPTQS